MESWECKYNGLTWWVKTKPEHVYGKAPEGVTSVKCIFDFVYCVFVSFISNWMALTNPSVGKWRVYNHKKVRPTQLIKKREHAINKRSERFQICAGLVTRNVSCFNIGAINIRISQQPSSSSVKSLVAEKLYSKHILSLHFVFTNLGLEPFQSDWRVST